MAIPNLIVVGLDAATFDVIDPLVEAGELPNLGACCNEVRAERCARPRTR